ARLPRLGACRRAPRRRRRAPRARAQSAAGDPAGPGAELLLAEGRACRRPQLRRSRPGGAAARTRPLRPFHMRPLRIAIVFDALALAPNAPADVAGVLETVDAVQHSLGELGHFTWRLPLGGGAVP